MVTICVYFWSIAFDTRRYLHSSCFVIQYVMVAGAFPFGGSPSESIRHGAVTEKQMDVLNRIRKSQYHTPIQNLQVGCVTRGIT